MGQEKGVRGGIQVGQQKGREYTIEWLIYVYKWVRRIAIIAYLFNSIVVNLSCKNSHYYTVQEEQF